MEMRPYMLLGTVSLWMIYFVVSQFVIYNVTKDAEEFEGRVRKAFNYGWVLLIVISLIVLCCVGYQF